MKKKAKIISSIILIVVIGIATTITLLSVNKISYAMYIDKPSRIVVCYNAETNNQVFSPGDDEYNKIYNLIMNSYKQPIIKAFVSGDLNKKVKIQHVEQSTIEFDGIKVNFVYDTPRAVYYKKDIYTSNGESYWYQNLVFNISNANKFSYNWIAIIPPETSSHYIDNCTYDLQYLAYSNFSNCYNYLNKKFN